jgi:phage gp29-like protein
MQFLTRLKKSPDVVNRRAGILSRLGEVFNRAASALSIRLHVDNANRWRDGFNPLRGLTIPVAVNLLERGERGDFAALQWLYRYIEMSDATLGACVERRQAAIKKLDWNIKVREDAPAELQSLIDEQQLALKSVYENIRNLKKSWETLCLATFRGYAILEIVREDNQIVELAHIPQWHWTRDGLDGEWWYNERASQGVSTSQEIDGSRLIVREVERPVDRVALIAFIRKALSQKDWDAYIETYGVPAIFLILPPDVPAEREQEYLNTAQQVVSQAKGALPHGSDIKTVVASNAGNNPFAEHINYQDAQVVLRATGGKLTMLNESTGMGSGQSDAHQQAFDDLAKSEAADISELLNEQITRPFLEDKFPNQEHWVYFEIAANEETDTKAIVEDAETLARAGYVISPEFLQEKTGYDLAIKIDSTAPAPPLQVSNNAPAAVLNREDQSATETSDEKLFTALETLFLQSAVDGYEQQQGENPEV